MTIPQVNALATDRNREQTKRICGLRKCTYWQDDDTDERYAVGATPDMPFMINLPNGSFTLDQVVGMLEAEVGGWECGDCAFEYGHGPGLWSNDDPHDLTENMDALIKVLETKGESHA